MNPGDIILVSRGNGILDRLVRWATVTPYFHAAMVVDSERLIEAAFGGVRYRPVDTYAGRSSVLSLKGATAAQREAAVQWAQMHWGTPYGWRTILIDTARIGLHLPIGYGWRRLSHLDCSCFVTAAWWQAGVPLTFVPAPTPGDLGFSVELVGPRPWAKGG